MSRKLVVTACGDPGGANALAPVLEQLASDGRVELRNFAYRQGAGILAARNLAFHPIPSQAPADWCADQLRDLGAHAVLTATSFNAEEHEKQFIAAAARLGLPSIAVLDFWSSYGSRFADAQGRLRYVPDRIAAMDDTARQGLIEAGIAAERIAVTGHPGFDAIAARRAAFSQAERQALRRDMGADERGVLVLFASQPLGQLYGTDASSPGFRGFDEKAMLDAVVPALERFAAARGVALTLIIRPHPREETDAYAARHSPTIRIRVSKHGDARACAMAADLVLGMTTMLLVEACHLGVPVISLQPGWRGPVSLPELPGIRVVQRYDDIAATLEVELEPIAAGEKRRVLAGPRGSRPGAASAVVRLVYDALQL